MLVFTVCITVIAVFTDANACVSKADFAAFAVITVGLHCICCDHSHSCCEGQKQPKTVKTNMGKHVMVFEQERVHRITQLEQRKNPKTSCVGAFIDGFGRILEESCKEQSATG